MNFDIYKIGCPSQRFPEIRTWWRYARRSLVENKWQHLVKTLMVLPSLNVCVFYIYIYRILWKHFFIINFNFEETEWQKNNLFSIRWKCEVLYAHSDTENKGKHNFNFYTYNYTFINIYCRYRAVRSLMSCYARERLFFYLKSADILATVFFCRIEEDGKWMVKFLFTMTY